MNTKNENYSDCIKVAAKAPAAQAVDAPDAEHVARIVADEDKAALLKIVAGLGWSVNGTWVITKSGEQMHTLDALAFARTVRSILAASPTGTPEASQQGDAWGHDLVLMHFVEGPEGMRFGELQGQPFRAAAVAAPSDDFGHLRVADGGKSVTIVAAERFWGGDCQLPDGVYRIAPATAVAATTSENALGDSKS